MDLLLAWFRQVRERLFSSSTSLPCEHEDIGMECSKGQGHCPHLRHLIDLLLTEDSSYGLCSQLSGELDHKKAWSPQRVYTSIGGIYVEKIKMDIEANAKGQDPMSVRAILYYFLYFWYLLHCFQLVSAPPKSASIFRKPPTEL
ncbi:unnamed protein product [Choristocarpus tenellus]